MDFKRIDVASCKGLIEKQQPILIDIRDEASYCSGHIEDALHIEQITIESFTKETDKVTPIVVYCYHGNTSLSAAQYFCDQGFQEVYSLDGGYDLWVRA